jgi:transcriptional regulator with XRE-family HTH domain
MVVLYPFRVPIDLEALPKLLKHLRVEGHLTLREVADSVGVPLKTLGGWERGRSKAPYDKLAELFAYFNVHDFHELQRRIDAMYKRDPDPVDLIPQGKPTSPAEMLRNAPDLLSFALDYVAMAARVKEYAEEIRGLTEANAKLRLQRKDSGES